LVADFPGVTRDRIYGRAEIAGQATIVVDTGGLDEQDDELAVAVRRQSRAAIEQADVVVFLTDARDGVLSGDLDIVAWLRTLGIPIVHAANKTDGLGLEQVLADAAESALEHFCPISAAHRRGLDALRQTIGALLPLAPVETPAGAPLAHDLVLIGRPNAGKSTLLNRLAGQEHALASALPGTTRDPVKARVERDGLTLDLVDTAGIRRRRGAQQGIERFSTIKALQAMEQARLVALIMDAEQGVSEQDARLAGHAIDAGRALILVFNKWDLIDSATRSKALKQVAERLRFASFAPLVTVSALHGSGLGELTDAIAHVLNAADRTLPTPELTRVLHQAVEEHPPAGGKRAAPKLRYAHSGGTFPTRIVIHGTRTKRMNEAYRRFLRNRFRAHFKLTGIPLRLLFRDSENPYSAKPPTRRGKRSARR